MIATGWARSPDVIADRWAEAPDFPAWLETVARHRDAWRSAVGRAAVPADLAARARAVAGRWHLLVLTEDWCGDAIAAVPVIAAVAGCTASMQLRCLPRDRNLDLMDEHLTDGQRSIPKLLVYDDAFIERGSWGPRPAGLQAWVLAEGRRLPSATRYEYIHAWHSRDAGRSVIAEMLDAIERSAADASAASA